MGILPDWYSTRLIFYQIGSSMTNVEDIIVIDIGRMTMSIMKPLIVELNADLHCWTSSLFNLYFMTELKSPIQIL